MQLLQSQANYSHFLWVGGNSCREYTSAYAVVFKHTKPKHKVLLQSPAWAKYGSNHSTSENFIFCHLLLVYKLFFWKADNAQCSVKTGATLASKIISDFSGCCLKPHLVFSVSSGTSSVWRTKGLRTMWRQSSNMEKGSCKQGKNKLFSRADGERTKNNRFRLQQRG